MVGIKAYGLSLPLYRLSRSEIHKAWQLLPFPMKGERSVANFDEDSLTLAVNAARDCLTGENPRSVDGIFCCSTTFPYHEKLSSATAAVALDMRGDISVVDIGNGLRSGTTGISLALDIIKAGSSQKVLVTASDCRMGAPGGELEQSIGDAGVALLLGEEDVIAEVEHKYTVADEFCGMWRSIDFETYAQNLCHETYDYKEGHDSFLEKRLPEFKGK